MSITIFRDRVFVFVSAKVFSDGDEGTAKLLFAVSAFLRIVVIVMPLNELETKDAGLMFATTTMIIIAALFVTSITIPEHVCF